MQLRKGNSWRLLFIDAMTGERLLRALIREEIGRNLRRGERVDYYPWSVDDINVSIIYDNETNKFWAFVEEISTGKVNKKLLPDEAEARHWARQQIDDMRRKEFSRV